MDNAPSLSQTCPPHHWLIDEDRSADEPRRVWRCLRCSEEREEAITRVVIPNRKYRSVSSWSREECILAGLPVES